MSKTPGVTRQRAKSSLKTKTGEAVNHLAAPPITQLTERSLLQSTVTYTTHRVTEPLH